MYDNTVITEELKKAVGIEAESGLIKRFAEAVGDSNPQQCVYLQGYSMPCPLLSFLTQ